MMLLKYCLTSLTTTCKKINILNRSYTSALYITGDKATTTCAILTPYIDFENQFKNIDKITKNIEDRGLTVDVAQLHQLWNLYQDLDKTKKKLDHYRGSVADEIQSLKSKPNHTEEEITKLINRGKIVRDDLKHLKEHLQPIQENVITKILELPNTLHDLTPRMEPRIDYTHLSKSTQRQPETHIIIGEKLKLLNYMNANTYYLTGDAALMEQGFLHFFSDHLENNDYIPFCNPDFARSVIVEGCGVDYQNLDKVFTLQDLEEQTDPISKLHLTGGASLFAFMAYHTKLTLYQTVLPLQYFSSGRQYVIPKNINYGLFDASQSSCIHVFSATLDSDKKALEQFTNLLGICCEAYKELGYHFRVVYRTSFELQKSESLRVSFEMHSSHLDKYIEVGHLSMYDTFLSKRLLFTYKEGKKYIFPKIISGTVANFAKLLGCVLEDNANAFVVPNVCKISM